VSNEPDDDWEVDDDALLLAEVDAATAAAQRAAGARLDYSRACPSCCFGPFGITPLDARRLRRGLGHLRRSDPARAHALEARVNSSMAALAPDVDPAPAVPHARCNDLPCPVLDPTTGCCDLYAWRPITCRRFGPPLRVGHGAGTRNLPPCRLCYAEGLGTERATCLAVIDPTGREDVLLDALATRDAERGQTIIADALARALREPHVTPAS
jgi:Fe-S-cluster containining protein